MNLKFLISTLLLSLCFSCSYKSQNPEIAKWEAQAKNIDIYRDGYGVPHIYGKTDADAVFGLLYAQCEDDFPRVERNFAWAIGRLAEQEGEQALYSDLRARLFMTEAEAKAFYSEAPDWLQALCEAWADGINFYLHKHPNVKPKVIHRFEPWMTMYFTEGSIGGDIERVSTKKLQAFYEGNTLALNDQNDPQNHLLEPAGSNGFAIAGSRTASGNAMLLINPHTSFYFRGEVHMVSEEGLNAYGAVTWGQFFVYQGFNETTGWMHTSTYTDVIDEFAETISKDEEVLHYQYGEEARTVEQQEVTIKYKEGEEIKERKFPIYRTHHGPITHEEDGKWIATALMWKPVDALVQSYSRTKMKNHAAFRKMMDLRTNSSNNTVFADSEGNIAYYHGNFIPVRDDAFDYTHPVDGSNPATDWQGLHTVDEAITIFNPPNGWIQNCNSTPFTAAEKYSPKREDYPSYMSRIPENFRGVHAIRLLKEADSLTLDKLIALAYDPYLPAFEQVIPGLLTAYDGASVEERAELKAPIEVLKSWDMTTSTTSVGMTLAHFYGTNLYKLHAIPAEIVGMDRFHHFGTGLPEQDRLKTFRKALDEIEQKFGSWNTAWGEVNRFQRIDGTIGASFDDDKPSVPVGLTTGRWGALAAYGMRTQQKTKKIYGTRGNSFVAVVEFGDKVRAKTLLAGGQSGDPASPHFDDQVEMYVNGTFKEVSYYKTDVEQQSSGAYHPGEEFSEN